MYSSLFPRMLEVRATPEQSIDLAARHGFEGVDLDLAQFDDLSSDDVSNLRERFAATGTRPGYLACPPGRMPIAETDWTAALEALPQRAKIAQALGYERAAIVLLPFHETLPRDAAIEDNVRHLQRVLPILADHGIRLGVEYVAAPSRRAPYPAENHTVWNLSDTLELLKRTGQSNAGLMLDTFHWHGAGETTDDLKRLTNEQVVVVHVNDAPPVALSEQQIMQRALPGATGVVDASGFFGALRDIGYDGPVTCEPMTPAIGALHATSDGALLTSVRQAMRNVGV